VVKDDDDDDDDVDDDDHDDDDGGDGGGNYHTNYRELERKLTKYVYWLFAYKCFIRNREVTEF
jgi:hypothetical protein